MPYKNPEDKKRKDKEYREKNKEKINKQKIEWAEKNKEKIRKKMEEKRKDKNSKVSIKLKEYREKNKEKIKKYLKEYYQKNKERMKNKKKEYQREYIKTKKKIDPKFKIDSAISCALYHYLLKRNLKKNGRKWESLVGYTAEDLINHLESLFKEGMTWDNYGSYWHIDHIRPKSWFLFESTEDQAFKDCWALSNLQPLEATANISKGNRYEG